MHDDALKDFWVKIPHLDVCLERIHQVMDDSFLWVFRSIPFDVQVWLAGPSVLNKLVEMPAFGIYLEQSILDEFFAR